MTIHSAFKLPKPHSAAHTPPSLSILKLRSPAVAFGLQRLKRVAVLRAKIRCKWQVQEVSMHSFTLLKKNQNNQTKNQKHWHHSEIARHFDDQWRKGNPIECTPLYVAVSNNLMIWNSTHMSRRQEQKQSQNPVCNWHNTSTTKGKQP